MPKAIKVTFPDGTVGRINPAPNARLRLTVTPAVYRTVTIPARYEMMQTGEDENGNPIIGPVMVEPARQEQELVTPEVTRPETDDEFFLRVAAKDCPQGATWALIEEGDMPSFAPAPYILHKTTLLDRMTDAELALFNTAMNAAPVRQRLMWQSTLHLWSNHPMFTLLQAQLTAAFGSNRVSELLAKE